MSELKTQIEKAAEHASEEYDQPQSDVPQTGYVSESCTSNEVCDQTQSQEPEFAKIPVLEEKYEISKDGIVRRVADKKLIKTHLNKTGYWRVNLREKYKTVQSMTHRLILLAWVGPAPEGHHAAHLNGNREDNRLENLAWVTAKENRSHMREHGTLPTGEAHGMSKLSWDEVLDIKKTITTAVKKAATDHGVTTDQIGHILSGKSWKSVPRFIEEELLLREQLEQACTPDQVKERIESVQREWKHHCDELESQLEQAKRELGAAVDISSMFRERLEMARNENLHRAETNLKLAKQLTKAQGEKIEAAKDAARYADLFYKAQAELKDSKHWHNEARSWNKPISDMCMKLQAELDELKRYHQTWDVKRAMTERDQFQTAALSFRKTADRYREVIESALGSTWKNDLEKCRAILQEALAEKEV